MSGPDGRVRSEVRYTLASERHHEEFTMWTAHQVWDFIATVMEPGDTLCYLPETTE